MPRLQRVCLCVLLAEFSAGIASSQTVSATPLGTVTDVNGAVVPNAKVTIKDEPTARASHYRAPSKRKFPLDWQVAKDYTFVSEVRI